MPEVVAAQSGPQGDRAGAGTAGWEHSMACVIGLYIGVSARGQSGLGMRRKSRPSRGLGLEYRQRTVRPRGRAQPTWNSWLPDLPKYWPRKAIPGFLPSETKEDQESETRLLHKPRANLEKAPLLDLECGPRSRARDLKFQAWQPVFMAELHQPRRYGIKAAIPTARTTRNIKQSLLRRLRHKPRIDTWSRPSVSPPKAVKMKLVR